MFTCANLRQSNAVINLIMILVIVTGAIETDIFVPSFPELKVYFNTSETLVQMIVGINFIGLCISSLIYGPMTDTYGRRGTLLIGMGLFLLASIGCLLAKSIEALLFWRFMQGLGTSAAFVVPAAVLFDIYSKKEAAKIIGFFSATITFSMSLAPMIGNYLNNTFGWQANFIFIGVMGMLSFILILTLVRETLPPENKVKIDYLKILRNYLKILTHRVTFVYLFISCTLFAGYIIYITNLSLIFMDHLQVDEAYYGYYQGAVLFVFALVSLVAGRIIGHLGIKTARNTGLLITLMGGLALLFVAGFFTDDPLYITIAMCLYCAGYALCQGIIFSEFMDVFPDIKGLVSAMSNFTRLLFSGFAIAVSGLLFTGTIIPVAIMVAIYSVLSVVGIFYIPRVVKG